MDSSTCHNDHKIVPLPQNMPLSCPFVVKFSPTPSLKNIDLSSIAIVLFFTEWHVNGIWQHVNFWILLLSLGMKHLRFIHAAVFISSSFLCITEYYSTKIDKSLFIHLPTQEVFNYYYKYFFSGFCMNLSSHLSKEQNSWIICKCI